MSEEYSRRIRPSFHPALVDFSKCVLDVSACDLAISPTNKKDPVPLIPVLCNDSTHAIPDAVSSILLLESYLVSDFHNQYLSFLKGNEVVNTADW